MKQLSAIVSSYFKKLFIFIVLITGNIYMHAQIPLAFTGTPTPAGTPGAVNATYTYSNIGTTGGITIRGVVKIVAITGGATLNTIDGTSGGSLNALQPVINGPSTANGGCWGITFSVSFFNNATGTPLTLSSFRVSGVDIDGDDGTLREYNEFDGITSYTVETPTSLTVTKTPGLNRYNFKSAATQYAGISTTQTNVIVSCLYNNTSSFQMTLGSCCSGGSCSATGTNRQTSMNFFDAILFTNAHVVLPVTFVSVNAESLADGNKISWEVAEQQNLLKYEIERSTDGVSFTSVGTVAAIPGNSNRVYTYFDPVVSGTCFYRIKNVDVDGRFSYSKTVRTGTGNSSQQLTVLNNPLKSSLEFKFVSSSAQKLQLRVVDNNGGLVLARNVTAGKGENVFQVNETSKLSGGLYILSVTDKNNNKYHSKFYKD